MTTLTITIDNAQTQDYLDGIARKHPIPLNPNGTPQYTKAQWARLRLKRHIAETIRDQRNYMAVLAVSVPRDDNAVTVT